MLYKLTDIVNLQLLVRIIDESCHMIDGRLTLFDQSNNIIMTKGQCAICTDLCSDRNASCAVCPYGVTEVRRPINYDNNHFGTLVFNGYCSNDETISTVGAAGKPVLTRTQINHALAFYHTLIEMLIDNGLEQLQLRETQKQLQQANAELAITIGERIEAIAKSNITLKEDLAARRQTEEVLRENEQWLKLILEQMPVMMDAFDETGKLVLWNRECERTTGYTAAEMIGHDRGWEYLYPDKEYRTSIINEIKKRGNDYRDFETTLVCKDGSTKTIAWFDSSARYLMPGWSYWAFGIDITDRKQVEEELRQASSVLRTMLKALPDTCFRINADGNILYSDFTGDDKVFTLWSTYFDQNRLMLENIKQEIIEAREKALLTGSSAVVECMLTGLEREEYFELRIVPFLDDQLIVLIRNITEQKQVEMALQESKERYRNLFEEAMDGIIIVDSEGRYIDVNQHACIMLGYTREEIIGKRFPDLHSPSQMRQMPQPNQEQWMPPLASLQSYIKRKDGSIFPAEVSKRRTEDGCLQVVIRDITEDRRMEEELSKAEKNESIKLLAAGIAHDFNNMLTAIIGNITLSRLHAGTEESSKTIQRLNEVEKAVQQARDLARRLLIFAKGDVPFLKTASIVELIKESVGFALSGSNVRCNFQIKDDIWPVEIDVKQVSQVINNLIINAKQAMVGGGEIEVIVENISSEFGLDPVLKGHNYVRIKICDHGVGIPREYLRKIFDPYFTTKPKVSGLGLAMVYSIIRRHGGQITVDSELDQGTTFTIYLPAALV